MVLSQIRDGFQFLIFYSYRYSGFVYFWLRTRSSCPPKLHRNTSKGTAPNTHCMTHRLNRKTFRAVTVTHRTRYGKQHRHRVSHHHCIATNNEIGQPFSHLHIELGRFFHHFQRNDQGRFIAPNTATFRFTYNDFFIGFSAISHCFLVTELPLESRASHHGW